MKYKWTWLISQRAQHILSKTTSQCPWREIPHSPVSRVNTFLWTTPLMLSRIPRTWKDSLDVVMRHRDSLNHWRDGRWQTLSLAKRNNTPYKTIKKCTISVPSLFLLRKTGQSLDEQIKWFWHLRNNTSWQVLQIRSHPISARTLLNECTSSPLFWSEGLTAQKQAPLESAN